jgi:PAS domain S-box-containing protein
MDQISIIDEPTLSDVGRPTLGLLISNILKDQPFLSGAAMAARRYGVNLVCIAGKNLNWQEDFAYQGNILYSIVDPQRLAGVITWAGVGAGIGQGITQAEMDRFFQRFVSRPVINYEKVIPGLHSIRTDTTQGMEAILRHLVTEHGRRRIVLVRGPAGHFETEERVRAYKNVLREFQIQEDPALIFPPMEWEMARYDIAFSQVMDERGLNPGVDFDGVAGTEPYLAVGAIRAIQARGVMVPDTVAVVGFNDYAESLAVTPTLTTVRKSFFGSGYQAVEVLLDLINGKSRSEEILIPAEIILRQSCGCLPHSTTWGQVVAEDTLCSGYTSSNPCTGSLTLPPNLLPALTSFVQPIANQLPADWADILWISFASDMRGDTHFVFNRTFNELIEHGAHYEENLTLWNQVLVQFRNAIRPCLNWQDQETADVLWQQAQISLSEADLQSKYRLTITIQNQRDLLDLFGIQVNSINSIETLAEALSQALARLKIPSCYLSLYEDPKHSTEFSRLIMAYVDFHPVSIDPLKKVFPSAQLVPEDLLPAGRSFCLVVEPLYYQQQQLGMIVFELSEGDGSIFELLQIQISNVLHRLLIEQGVREQEAQFRAMAEAAPIGIFLLDGNGAMTYFNPVFQSMTGLSHANLIGKTWQRVTHPMESEAVAAKWETSLREGQTFSQVIGYRNHEDQSCWWDLRITPIRVGSQLTGFVGMAQDVTKNKLAEDLIHRSNEELEKRVEERTAQLETVYRDLETFSYSISHDLRAPLRAIAGYISIFLSDYNDQQSEDGKAFLEKVIENSITMSDKIDSLLTYIRLARSKLKFRTFSLSQMVEEVWAEYCAAEPDRKVEMVIQPGLDITGDVGAMRVVLEHLLSNAWKFTSRCQTAQVEFGMEMRLGEVVYYIRDNGAGFNMQYVGKLFGTFQRLHDSTEYPGLGMGLAIAKKVIQRHHGRIWAQAEIGKGATFYFTLPLR